MRTEDELRTMAEALIRRVNAHYSANVSPLNFIMIDNILTEQLENCTPVQLMAAAQAVGCQPSQLAECEHLYQQAREEYVHGFVHVGPCINPTNKRSPTELVYTFVAPAIEWRLTDTLDKLGEYVADAVLNMVVRVGRGQSPIVSFEAAKEIHRVN